MQAMKAAAAAVAAAEEEENRRRYGEEDSDEDRPRRNVHKATDDAYVWEQDLDRPWELLVDSDKAIERGHAERRRRTTALADTRSIRRGMNRHMFLIVDTSLAMDARDMEPNRLGATLRVLEHFVREYFDQNPISQLGIIVTHDGIAEKVTSLSSNPHHHIKALQAARSGGDVSLQNALQVGRTALQGVPHYGSREIVVVFGSLATCDPGDIHETIAAMAADSIRCSVVCLSAELYVCKKLAMETKGTFTVPLDVTHFGQLMASHVPPPPELVASKEVALMRMGFPQRKSTRFPSLCVCHKTLRYGGYECAQCRSKYCELPMDCQICGLSLVSSPHLARSYHHLFPVPGFVEMTISDASCYGCGESVLGCGTKAYQCPLCRHKFCLECDIFIHESVTVCPGCEERGSQSGSEG